VDAHGYGKRFVVRADEILTVFVELLLGIDWRRGHAHIPSPPSAINLHHFVI